MSEESFNYVGMMSAIAFNIEQELQNTEVNNEPNIEYSAPWNVEQIQQSNSENEKVTSYTFPNIDLPDSTKQLPFKVSATIQFSKVELPDQKYMYQMELYTSADGQLFGQYRHITDDKLFTLVEHAFNRYKKHLDSTAE